MNKYPERESLKSLTGLEGQINDLTNKVQLVVKNVNMSNSTKDLLSEIRQKYINMNDLNTESVDLSNQVINQQAAVKELVVN
jgi:uncharacterized coiled-coil DUF342 family protein